MSCQQASRFIANNSKNNINNNNCKQNINNHSHHCAVKGNRLSRSVVQQEDPYVFTESVPTTPPILFNTQKTRTRLNDLTSTNAALSIGKLQQHKQQKLPLTETNGKITTNILKTQASLLSSSLLSISSSSSLSLTTTVTNSTNTKTFNTSGGVTQSLAITTAANNCNSKKLTNVCIVRPQLQQQQQHQHYINEEDLKSISPPPLYTPPTASLWQTPLLLESTTAPTTTTTTTTLITNASTPQITNVARQQASNPSPIMGCVSPTVVQTIGNTTSIMNPSLNTTAMAKVAPIVVHTPPLAPPPPPLPKQCLPPSKFHNHTLAQHLQKVECLKQSKKFDQTDKISACNENIKSDTTPSSPTKAASLKTLDSSAASQTLKHSEKEDLNEIPVNVIFRMAAVTQQQQQQQQNEKYDQNLSFVRPAAIEQQTEKGQEQVQKTLISTPPPPSLSVSSFSPPSSLQSKTTANVNRKLSIPASKTNTTHQLVKQQVHTSSTQQQHQQQNNAKTKITALNYDDSKPANAKTAILSLKNSGDETSTTTTSIAVTKTNLKSKTPSTHISNKISKFNFMPSCTSSSNLTLNLPYNSWQMGCSTTKGAVAIVKMSQHKIDLDTTHLATATGLPYCLQHYWLDTNSNDYRKSSKILVDGSINRSLAREERIALYKQQLRRQAMQLLSTRSLQKLPIQIARRRLLCVDRLLRKYQHNEQNVEEQPANVKRCCVNGCDGHTLEMATHCQQHIVYNSAQHVFLPCTAKFADNTQCRIPVFDIAHDLPLCIEHARKRDAYNRLLYEQRPRNISTNPTIRNDSMTAASTSSATSKITSTEGASGVVGVIMKNQQQQQQQQQKQLHKHVQQLPLHNRSNGNKRPALANQQQQTRKRKMTNGTNAAATAAGNTVGRPQKRVRKTLEKSATLTTTMTTKPTTIPLNTIGNTMTNQQQLPRLTSTSLKRKSSTTSLESIASNSQHSTISVTSQQPPLYSVNSSHVTTTATSITTTSTTSLPPPALAPLSSSGFGLVGHGLPQHLFSYGHDNIHQQPQLLHTLNLNDKHSLSSKTTTSTATASTPTELKDFISQFALASQKHSHNNNEQSIMSTLSTCDINLLNTNSNSNFTSSGMGSTTSLPTADDFLTQDMLSICENSSASSADTGLGGLSDPELMLGGPDDDIPLGDTHLLEEHDLETVLNSLPEDAFKELFTTVHQDESDEIERAIELADKHLKTLQQTIGSELGDYLDFADDMLMDNGGDLCNESTVTANSILDTTALFIGGGTMGGQITATATAAQSGVPSVMGTEIRGGLVQT
ncbi:hypothetical protein DOY81_006904 [Sarcophaga bullata]|nr:hypothetical protein DOY81_006904 [Sarcophaga bullata]